MMEIIRRNQYRFLTVKYRELNMFAILSMSIVLVPSLTISIRKTFYQRELRMPHKYCPRKMRGNEKTKTFKRKRENGQLLVQHLRELFCNLMREIPLSKHVEFIQFGNCVQLKAPDMPAFPPLQAGDNYGVILAGTVPDDEVEKAKKLSNGHGIACSPILQPTARNAFLIKSADSRDKDGQNLLFGQEFVLQLVGTDEPLYVRAETPINMSAARGPRQHNPVVISNKRDCYCNWKVFHWNSNKRFDTEGAPFSPFFRVIICHVMTGKCLTVEAVDWYLSIVGLECGVSVHTYLNSHKHETAECMWMFVTENI